MDLMSRITRCSDGITRAHRTVDDVLAGLHPSALHVQVRLHGGDEEAGAGGAVHRVSQLWLQDVVPDQGCCLSGQLACKVILSNISPFKTNRTGSAPSVVTCRVVCMSRSA